MNKIIIALVALLLSSSSVSANDRFVRTGGGYGAGGAGYSDRHYGGHHDHRDHRGPSLGRVVAGALILGTAAVIIDRALPQPPQVICRDMPEQLYDQYGRPVASRWVRVCQEVR